MSERNATPARSASPLGTWADHHLYSFVASLGRVFIGPVAGVLADAYGWPLFFIVSLVVGVPGLILAWRMRRAVDETALARQA